MTYSLRPSLVIPKLIGGVHSSKWAFDGPQEQGSWSLKTAAQTRRAMDEREANAQAKAAGKPMPYANPWDASMEKPPEGASREEQRRWASDIFDRYAPRR